ncbi:MAG: hypothetical protein AAF618_08365 [Pseudomonadota bacterium]
MQMSDADPKGLIREAYNIEGITAGECRSIFLDWAINVPQEADTSEHVRFLLGVYGADKDDHPMTQTLRQALDDAPKPKRRGGRRARVVS